VFVPALEREYQFTKGQSALLLSTSDHQSAKAAASGGDLKNTLFSREFLLVALGMFGGTFAGLLIVGNLKPLRLVCYTPRHLPGGKQGNRLRRSLNQLRFTIHPAV